MWYILVYINMVVYMVDGRVRVAYIIRLAHRDTGLNILKI